MPSIERTPPSRRFPKGGWRARYRDPQGKSRRQTFPTRAAAQRFMGAHREAEDCHRRALDLRLAKLPADHPDIGISLHNLASVMAVGRPAEAEALYRRAIEIYRAADGDDHPDLQHGRRRLRDEPG